MRAARVAGGLAVLGLALVPAAGCSSDDDGSSSQDSPAAIAHVGHPDEGVEDAAPPTSAAAPTRLDIEATEYEWSGLPDELPAGTYPMTFHNAGVEAHEISIFRNTDDRPLPELFELGPEGIKGAVEMVGTLIAGPGAPADGELTVTLTPGEYDVVCFIPAMADGLPHFEHGMHRTLVVR
ncbi:MAG: hypothetical protein M3Y51_01610 [Actinomycetota bacterium]|nr:hypothetical protein [Actinomycetota bacterium]